MQLAMVYTHCMIELIQTYYSYLINITPAVEADESISYIRYRDIDRLS